MAVNVITQAINQLDPKFCDTLKDPLQNSTCHSKVSDQKIYVAALERANLKDCAKITAEGTRGQCEISVAKAIEYKQKIEQSNEEQQILSNISENSSSQDCENLSDSNFQLECFYRLYSSQARAKNDPALCEKIANETLVAECKSVFQ